MTGDALAAVRAVLARAAFGLVPDTPLPDPALGTIRLHPHQRVAVARLAHLLATDRGALLADDVGLGKTVVALALVRTARRPLVVVPAGVRPVWLRAMQATGVHAPLRSLESLGRPEARLPAPPDLLVVDEAHHARTRATRRWQALATLAVHARVLLLSATPVHNTPRDLAALLALFLGDRALVCSPALLARHVVRRRIADLPPARPGAEAPGTEAPRPRILPTVWHPLPPDAARLAALLALPPPLPPRDGAPADALHAHTLVRLWTSSDGALHAALRRRLARATALAHALADGRHLDRRALRAWCADATGDAVQPELPLGGPTVQAPDAAPLALALHAAALRALLATGDTRRDEARAALLRALRARHSGARIVAFTQFADTARALYRRLAPDGRVALLTAGGGRIASGPIARRDLLARFAPGAAGLPPPREAERVDLLLATDCLSEGLDLRDAAVVVHLDLPWTPARLAQRVGRCARPGAPHDAVHVHALRPAADEARWLRTAGRLRRKSRAARRSLGAPTAAPARLARTFERWLLAGADGAAASARSSPHTFAVTAPVRGALAALRAPDGATMLVAVHDGRVRTDARALARAVRWLDAAPAPPTSLPPADRAAAVRALRRWCRRRRAAGALAGPGTRAGGPPDGAPPSAALRAVLGRLDACVRTAPAHRRAGRAVAAAELRARLGRPLGAGLERALLALGAATPDDDTWLAALRTALPSDDAPGRPATGPLAAPRWRLLALVGFVLRPPP